MARCNNKRLKKYVLIRVHRSVTALSDRQHQCGGGHDGPALQEFSLLGQLGRTLHNWDARTFRQRLQSS